MGRPWLLFLWSHMSLGAIPHASLGPIASREAQIGANSYHRSRHSLLLLPSSIPVPVLLSLCENTRMALIPNQPVPSSLHPPNPSIFTTNSISHLSPLSETSLSDVFAWSSAPMSPVPKWCFPKISSIPAPPNGRYFVVILASVVSASK